MKGLSVEIKNGMMFVAVPLQTPKLSLSGKSKVIATSHGMRVTKVTYDDCPVILSFNAFVNADEDEEEEVAVEEEEEAPVKKSKGVTKSNRNDRK
jgi:hypothetical protein